MLKGGEREVKQSSNKLHIERERTMMQATISRMPRKAAKPTKAAL